MVSGYCFADQAHGLQGLLGVGKGVARSGDAGHRDARFLFQHLAHVDQGLVGAEQGGGDAGPRLVDAVVLAVAVVALDVAFGGNRQMHPAVLAFGLDVEARMTIEIFFVKHNGAPLLGESDRCHYM